jgi:hypothetical protein
MPQPDEPPALDYFDGFTEPAPAEKPQEDSSAPAPSASAPGQSASQAADDADDGALDAELEAELDKQLFADQPASASKGAADASKSQAGDDDSEVDTIDEAADSDGEDARSREDSQQPEDPAQAEQQRQSVWYKCVSPCPCCSLFLRHQTCVNDSQHINALQLLSTLLWQHGLNCRCMQRLMPASHASHPALTNTYTAGSATMP